MITANELRIGNRLSPLRTIDYSKIPPAGYAISAAHIAYSEEELNKDWAPIPLTPDILEKCGFKPDSGGWKVEISVSMFLWWGELERTMRMVFLNGEFSYPIYLKEPIYHFQYLHQLQNLFFALTGEDLKVNL